MKYFLSVIFSFSITFLSAQSGNFLLSNYSPNKDRQDNVCFQMAQKENGIIYFATRSGILSFDGRSWDLINGNGAIYSVQIANTGDIYWSGANGFGVVSPNEAGLPELKIISENIKDVFQSLHFENKLYFLNEEKLIVYDPATKVSVVHEITNVTGSFSGIVQVGGVPIITTSKNMTLKIQGDKLVDAGLSLGKNAQIMFSVPFKNKQLLGISTNEIFVVENGKLPRKLTLEDQQYLRANVVVSGSWVNDDLIVLGTLRGGLVFINLANGKTHEIINYETGLPDNEIFSVVTDRDQCVWAAHEYGFTRIAPHMPFRSFNHYPGLSGNLLCAISFQNSVYVGTSLGLFKLEQENVFQERSYYETVTADTGGKDSRSNPTSPTQDQTQSKKRGLLRLFKKKEKSDAGTSAEKNRGIPLAEEKYDTKQKQILKKEQVLVTSTYRYKKVRNIDAKITQLLPVQGKLIACGLGGTYEISNLTGKVLVDDPTRHIFCSSNDVLFVSTYSDEVKTLRLNGTDWKNLNLLQNLNDQITYIFQGLKDELWLCALDKIYKIRIAENEIADLKIVDVKNPNYDEFVGAQLKDESIIVNTNGFYRYNRNESVFDKLDSTSNDKLATYFARDGSIWYRQSHGWNVLGADSQNEDADLLNLFKKVRFITADAKSENLWVITNNNELFKYFPDQVRVFEKTFPLVLKSVKNGDKKFGGSQVLEIDQDNSSLSLEVVQPDFLASDAIEYRYHIRGLDQGWTDWSQTNNIIEIAYLPSGDYILEVESKDIFGRQSSLEEITLNVLPPYWKRPWFYALEVLVFSLFVLLSFRLSTRYRIISRLLMLLTIIMLIQLAETVIGDTLVTKTSPVVDFLIQVVIAMLVLPIEGYLRELMLKSLNTSNRFYRFIAPGSRKLSDDSE